MKQHKNVKPVLRTTAFDIARCFDSAMYNVLNINTAPCDYDIYNGTGLLQHPFMVRAGGDYDVPWTRDAAINTWQAVNLLDPQTARTTLLAVCTVNEAGKPIVQPDK